MQNYKKTMIWTIVVSVIGCIIIAVCVVMNSKGSSKGQDIPMETSTGAQVETPTETPTEAQTKTPTEAPIAATDYSGYDELITQAKNVQENSDTTFPEEEKFSSVFYRKADYETLGYLRRDIDGNGIDELIFGANTDGWDNGNWDGVIYNIYTLVNGNVIKVLDGWERNRYYFCENGCIANESSSSAFESNYNYYTYQGTELTLVESVLYYERQDEENPWFHSTEQEPDIKNAKPISEEKAMEIMSKYVHEHPRYTPFVK